MQINHYIISSLSSLITTLLLGIFVYLKDPKRLTNKIFILSNLGIGIWNFGFFKMITSTGYSEGLFWARLLHVGAIFIPILFLHFIFTILYMSPRAKRILAGGYICSIVLLSFTFTSLFVSHAPSRFVFNYFVGPGPIYHLFTLYFFSCVVYSLYVLFTGYRSAKGLKRNQIKYLFFAYLIGYAGGGTAFLPLFGILTPPWGIYGIPLYTIIVTHAIIKYRLIDIRIAITRAGIFLAVYAFILGLPFYIGYRTKSWILSTSLAVVFATIGPLVYRLLDRKAEELLLTEQRNYQKLLLKSAKGMMKEHRLDKLLKWIVYVVRRTVGIRYTAIFLNDKEKKLFALKIKEDNGEIPDNLIFSYDHPFISYMQEKKAPFFYEEIPLPIRRSLNIPFEVDIVIPSFIEEQHLGFLILGEKLNREVYSQDDLNVFNILANQAGLAIENAQLYSELQEEAERLKQTINKLNEMQGQLIQTEKMAAVGTLSAGMAHEINNPLMGAMLLLQGVISKKEYKADEYKMLSEVEKELEAIARVISKLLLFSRKEELILEELDINTIIKDTVPLISHEFKLNNIDLITDYGTHLPSISASKNAIQQVLVNTLLNAKDAVLNSEVKKITISTFLGKDEVKVKIRDEGQGIKRENMNKLFDPFFTTKPPGKGLGMGLSIARTIMNQHRGRIDIYSKEQEGTEVILSFPCNRIK